MHVYALSEVGVVNGSMLSRACLTGAISDRLVISEGVGFRTILSLRLLLGSWFIHSERKPLNREH